MLGSEKPVGKIAYDYDTKRIERTINQVHIPTDYAYPKAYLDLAIIEINDVYFTRTIFPVCLPTFYKPADNRKGYAADTLG